MSDSEEGRQPIVVNVTMGGYTAPEVAPADLAAAGSICLCGSEAGAGSGGGCRCGGRAGGGGAVA